MFWLAPAIAASAALVNDWIGSKRQQKHNMELAKYQADANERYLDKQLAYNTPQKQMARFTEAGLNPHLVYGQGNPGNQGEPLRHPEIRPADFQSIGKDAVPLFNQTMLAQTQAAATQAKTIQTTVNTELQRLQKQVLERNPLLHDSAYNAIIGGLMTTAQLKTTELDMRKSQLEVQKISEQAQVSKVMKEVEVLDQKFKLGVVDENIKKEILNSKEFQNEILEIQKRFLTDGEIGPQQIWQFVQLLLMKLL